jgi:hypothetical protein
LHDVFAGFISKYRIIIQFKQDTTHYFTGYIISYRNSFECLLNNFPGLLRVIEIPFGIASKQGVIFSEQKHKNLLVSDPNSPRKLIFHVNLLRFSEPVKHKINYQGSYLI